MELISGKVIFIVWREALEAVLIIGIIYAYLKKSQNLKGIRLMWIGIGLGVILSAFLAWAMLATQSQLSGDALVYFQASVLVISAVLMTQMVLWMNRHGRYLKAGIEKDLQAAVAGSHFFGVAVVAALAIVREGSETVIYLYSMSLESASLMSLLLSSSVGVGLAASVAWTVSKGMRFLDTRIFFRVTGLILLISAAGLLSAATGKLVSENLVPGFVEPVWDSSGLFQNGFMQNLVGYNPRPSLTEVIVYSGYWIFLAMVFQGKTAQVYLRPVVRRFRLKTV